MATSSSSASTSISYGTPVNAKDRTLRGASDLSNLYGGVDYDRSAIEGIYQNATNAQYAADKAAYDRTANQYYNRLATAQNAQLDAARKAQGSALVSGATKGMQAANDLSTVLGLQQTTSADATKLATDARALSDKNNAQLSQDSKDALTYANQQKLALGTLDANLYATDAQKYAAELGANSQVTAANTAASAQGYTADQQLEGTRYNADQNLVGTRYTADQNLTGTKYSADQSLAGQTAYANAYQNAAAASAAANVTAAGLSANAQVESQRIAGLASIAGTVFANNGSMNDIEGTLYAYDNWAVNDTQAGVDYDNTHMKQGTS